MRKDSNILLLYAIHFNDIETIKEILNKDFGSGIIQTYNIPFWVPPYGGTSESLVLLHQSRFYLFRTFYQDLNNIRDKDGETLLYRARANIEIMELLLKNGKIDVNITNNKGENILFSVTGDDSMDLYFKYGVDVNHRNYNLDTPLHKCEPIFVGALINKGADLYARNKENDLPVHAMLRNHINDNSTYDLIFSNEKVGIINDKGKDGQTPLHIAVAMGFYSVVSYLIKHKAEKNIKDNNRKTPVDIAREKNDVKMLEILEDKN